MTEQKRIIGKIIRVDKAGWGFISSKEIPFTRIFFHWTSLNSDTAHFTELRKGMEVEFIVLEVPEKGYRAVRIDVLEPESESEKLLEKK